MTFDIRAELRPIRRRASLVLAMRYAIAHNRPGTYARISRELRDEYR